MTEFAVPRFACGITAARFRHGPAPALGGGGRPPDRDGGLARIRSGAADFARRRRDDELAPDLYVDTASQRRDGRGLDRHPSRHDAERRVLRGEHRTDGVFRWRRNADPVDFAVCLVRRLLLVERRLARPRHVPTMFSQPPASFKVAPETRITRVRVTRHSYTFVPDDLSIVVRWTTNVREVAVEATIRRGNRRVGRVRTTDETLLPLNPDSAYLTWNRPRKVRTGTRLALLISVRGGGRVAAVRRSVLAP
jgi:hypothetical protein